MIQSIQTFSMVSLLFFHCLHRITFTTSDPNYRHYKQKYCCIKCHCIVEHVASGVDCLLQLGQDGDPTKMNIPCRQKRRYNSPKAKVDVKYTKNSKKSLGGFEC